MSLTRIENSDIGASNLYFRNLIINGDMNIHQRGSSVSGITNNTVGSGQYYTADRIRFGLTSPVGTWTQTVEVDAPSGTGLNKSVKVTCTTANSSLSSGSTLSIGQNFEGQNLQVLKKGTPNAEPFTVSFWVKSNVVGTYICDIYDTINQRQISRSYTINSTGVWEKKVLTFPGDTAGTIPNDNNPSLYLNFFLGYGSNFTSGTLNTSWNSNIQANRAVGQVNLAATVGNYFQVTGVQMEVGTIATPFEMLPYEIQLMRCLRYYATFTVPQDYSDGYNNALLYRSYNLPVTMRTNPTGFSIINQFQYYSSGSATNFTPTFASVSRLHFVVFGAGLTAGRGIFGGTVGVNAEL